jgi:hypothetical protein
MSVKEDFAFETSTEALASTGEDFDKAAKPTVTATRVARTVIFQGKIGEDAGTVAGDDLAFEAILLYWGSSGNPDGVVLRD